MPPCVELDRVAMRGPHKKGSSRQPPATARREPDVHFPDLFVALRKARFEAHLSTPTPATAVAAVAARCEYLRAVHAASLSKPFVLHVLRYGHLNELWRVDPIFRGSELAGFRMCAGLLASSLHIHVDLCRSAHGRCLS